MEKIFVVGCSRSGTTVFQKKLVENSSLLTIPETRWYLSNHDSVYGRLVSLARLHASFKGRVVKSKLIKAIGGVCFSISKIGIVKTLRAIISSDFSPCVLKYVMNREARKKGFKGWLEKTPLHFRELEKILKDEPESKVIFLVRNGEDVVASIKDRYNKNPGVFYDQKSYEYGVNLWNEALTKAIKHKKNSRVKVVSYEEFVEHTDKVLEECLQFIGIPLCTNEKVFDFVRNDEKWKENSKKEVSRQENKARRVFSEEEVLCIKESLNKTGYESLFLNK